PGRLFRRIERVAMGRAVFASENAARAIPHTIARGVADRRLGGFDDHLHDPAHPAAVFAGPAGIGAEFVAAKKKREAHLGDFETAEFDTAGGLPFASSRPPVARGRGATAGARLEEMPDERFAPGDISTRIFALDRNSKAPAPARHRTVRAG